MLQALGRMFHSVVNGNRRAIPGGSNLTVGAGGDSVSTSPRVGLSLS
jgi:hypothetical protein